MAIPILHSKVNQIADWTQADLDAQIAAGNFPAGTVLADITLSSDWNDDHSSPELDILEQNVRGAVIVDMANGNYTLTDAQANASIWLIQNATGAGAPYTITIPTSSDGKVATTVAIVTGFAGAPFYIKGEATGISTLFDAPLADILLYQSSLTPTSLHDCFVNHDAYGAGWNGSLQAPTQDAVYDKIESITKATRGLVTKTGTSESTAATDAGKRVYCSNASAVTFTIEPSSTADLGENGTFRLQAGAGGITIAAGAGVTLVGSTTVAAYDTIICDRDGTTNTWYL